MIRTLDLFSGIGGFSLGLKRAGGFKTVAYCEIDPYCQAVLQARMLDGSLDTAPICTDITKLEGRHFRGYVDLICGGFPCQDVSEAGPKEGLCGRRSGLWGEMARIIREVGPRLVLVENVTGLLDRGFGEVLGDLAEGGFDAEWSVVSACSMGAPHMRERVFIVANAGSGGCPPGGEEEPDPVWRTALRETSFHDERRGRWPAEPKLDRMGNGVPNRVDRLGGLGNAIVPDCVEWIGRRIVKATS